MSILIVTVAMAAIVVMAGTFVVIEMVEEQAAPAVIPAAPVQQAATVTVPTASGNSADLPANAGALSLIELFERSESGVARVSVERTGSFAVGGIGSGFVFDKMGHIVTNAHVVTDATRIVVTLTDGMEYNAVVRGIDYFTDIAVIKVNADPARLHPLVLGDSSNLRVGEQVAAIGNPFGLHGSMTAGIVSQVGRLIPAPESEFFIPEVIQTDAAINPGNSGGPLLNMQGGVVGINTAIQSGTGEFTGIGFAVPSLTVAKIVPSLIVNGEYKHPWLGVSGQDINPDLARLMNLPDTLGFMIIDVSPMSPASNAGLRGATEVVIYEGTDYPVGGDIIRAIDDNTVRKIDDILIHLQRSKAVGDQAVLDVLRDGNLVKIVVTLGERPTR